MARSYALESFELDFFDRAPISYRIDVRIPVSPARAWAELTRQHTLDWCKAITSIEFTAPAPYGVGTTRTAKLARGLATLHEEFFSWTADPDTGRYHNAFRVRDASVPGIRRFGELTEISPAEVGSRLVWAFALELPSSARAVTAFSAPTASSVFKTV
ncbi:SRPBCC family protein [Gordonia sp. ABSL1-1]|uniref:SRPBCC family protein n=1 Tax=Gordonia sp. ABSL1-1 TaxID=3053923 RepID=UPI0025732048|nr:SRPBCC family protein [Gordonia sp. ABSL1-1]MDL9938436.1 SRPBCC family protein [Gordonia sp. ABSL1-1]